jgi:SAM-dependent methyltransferase
MAEKRTVADHYGHGQLLDGILDGIAKIGKTPETITIDDLAAVDEFHIGGRQATADFVKQFGLSASDHVLDVGCGIGGSSRHVAESHNCRVTGIDLTPEFVETGKILCGWVGMDDRISLHQGSALETGFDADGFDAAYMLHVGMNIADKTTLCAEVARVLRPDGVFGIFDVMKTNDEPLTFPVPWASVPDLSAVSNPETYKSALTDAGFEITAERDRRDFALDFFAQTQKQMAGASGPPALGLQITMGKDAPVKIKNMVQNITAGRIAPVEIIARKVS